LKRGGGGHGLDPIDFEFQTAHRFAIVDWSTGKRHVGPFQKAFRGDAAAG